MKRRSKLSIALMVLGIIIASCAPFVIRARWRARMVCCNCSLKQIGTACYLSTDDFGGYFPPSFSAMQKWGNSPKIYSCPETRPFPKTMQEVDSLSTYIYIAGLRPDDPGNCALALDHPANHGGDGGNVLFVDGHVEWVEQAALERLVREPWAGQEIFWPQGGPLDEMVVEDMKARITVIYQGRDIRKEDIPTKPLSATR